MLFYYAQALYNSCALIALLIREWCGIYRGQELRLVLWGDRAVEFEAESVRARDEKQAVSAIFVGTLPKMNQGSLYVCVLAETIVYYASTLY